MKDLDGLTGMNKLFGDAHVSWKTLSAQTRAAIVAKDPNQGFVRCYSTNIIAY